MKSAEEGHSLVEVSVALALLVTVLLPLADVLFSIGVDRRNELHVRALELGQSHMETALRERSFYAEEFDLEEKRWRIRRDVRVDGDRVTIIVRVWHRSGDDPLLTVNTMRLL